MPILALTLLLLIPAVFGMAATRINYDMLTYLPEDMETVVGQDELMKDFGKGAFSLIIVALCFMSFTMGRDLVIVMAKGVILGVIGCVTVLPAMILLLDRPLQRTRHRSLIPDTAGLSRGILKIAPVLLALSVLLAAPAWYGYEKTNDEVYYYMGQCLPEDMAYEHD